jgi:hypothetical protein
VVARVVARTFNKVSQVAGVDVKNFERDLWGM